MNSDDRSELFALTAGHVVANSIDDLIYALPEKPFQEAVKSIDIRIDDERREPSGRLAKFEAMKEKLKNVDRMFGNVAIVDMRVDYGNHFERVDYGLIRVFDKRAADNRLSKIHAFRLFDFVGDGDRNAIGEG